MTASFSFIIPTHREDRPLRRCLDSMAFQLGPKDEIIVCGDTTDAPLPGVERLVQSYGSQYRYLTLPTAEHDFGHAQANYGLSQAQGDYVALNDDDDVWTPDARDLMRRGSDAWPGKVLLFRFRHYNGTVYWVKVGQMERMYIGGHCLVTPNVPGKVGRFTAEYTGDFDYVESSVTAFGGPAEAIWISDLIAIARPLT